LALTGPSGVGKSTISRLLEKAFSGHIVPVPIVTTRSPKAGDQDEYQHVSLEEFYRLRDRGELVAFTSIPSSSELRWYGYRAEDLDAIRRKGLLPVVITEMHLLQSLADYYGRRSILSFGLLPPGQSKRTMLSQLLHRLRSRGRETEAQIADRLKNAKADLHFFETQKELFDVMLVNDNLHTVVGDFQAFLSDIPGTPHMVPSAS
jgi:guanylate kinase